MSTTAGPTAELRARHDSIGAGLPSSAQICSAFRCNAARSMTPADRRRLVAQHDVLGDGQLGDDRTLLVDDGNAAVLRRRHIVNAPRSPSTQDLARHPAEGRRRTS